MKLSKFLFFIYCYVISVFCACNDMIKNENGDILVEDGTKINESKNTNVSNPCIGNYVGMFEPDYGKDMNKADSIKYANATYAGESFIWTRENKISISIDEMTDGKIKGHSVVAGNERPFEGNYSFQNNIYKFTVEEPGDDKHDGVFSFTIQDTLLKGTWKAYAKINIQNRKYELYKKEFTYNVNVMLDTNETGYGNRYVDWTKPSMSKEEIKILKSKMSKEEREMYEDFEENTDFASATENIYKYNASKELLKEEVVANMKRGDIYIIRNTIYARHGYSFKYRPLRVFFDKQSWYVPYTANIQSQFSDIEKKNITLLLKYEKNAKEYYDSFGRG